ncbi:MAG: IS21-like element helper ATPase IstB [Nitrospira sp.]|nr:IS21-like element helper ATPase IstB [Nitrospira sp.]
MMSKRPTPSRGQRPTTKKTADWPPTIDTSKLPEQLKELRLPTFRETHLKTAEQAAREHWTHTQFLADLVDQECQTRSQGRILRLMRDANLLAGKTWEAFDWSRLPLHVTQQFETLRQGDFLNRRDNLLIFGKPGSGKTMLLSALGDQLVKQGRAVCFSTCQMLVQELLRAKRDLRLERFIKKLQKFEALIIDDLGYVQQSREEMEVLFTLLSERYERGSVLLSSNLPFSKWEQIFKDPMTTAAAIDRLIHHSVIIELNIPSYRLDEAKKKQPKSIRSESGSKT